MSLYSASSDSRSRTFGSEQPLRRGLQPGQDTQSPFGWARQRLTSRTSRRVAAAGHRAGHRLTNLGPAWHVVEWPEGMVRLQPREKDRDRIHERAAFLAVGPGGVYAVSAVDQGRQRVMVAGDVVQIKGYRPPLISEARKDARKASNALTEAVGTRVPVVAVLTFVGSGPISAQGLPNGCLVVNYRELDRMLLAAGEKISPATARKLADIANHPATWGEQYRWYPDGQTAGDKPPTPR